MERKDVKLELLKIFSDTKYEFAYIDEAFIVNYIRVMWKNIFDTCKTAIKSGREDITVDEMFISAYSGGYPPHERANVYQHMFPYIKEELDNSEIPYTMCEATFSKLIKFKVSIEDLKKFSNVDRLEALL